jgi:hypothetical protein
VCGCRRPLFSFINQAGEFFGGWSKDGPTDKSGGEEYKGRYLFYSHASFTPDRRAFEIARVRL